MTSQCEINICQSLRPILDSLPIGSAIPDSPEYRWALSALEWFIPEVFEEVNAKPSDVCLDGILPAVSRKTGKDEIEIIGLCILITDQTVTPIHVCFQQQPTRLAGWNVSLASREKMA